MYTKLNCLELLTGCAQHIFWGSTKGNPRGKKDKMFTEFNFNTDSIGSTPSGRIGDRIGGEEN